MDLPAENHSWFHPRDTEGGALAPLNDMAFGRLWHGFMTARVMIAIALLLLQILIHALGQPVSNWVLLVCGAYLMAALAIRVLARPARVGQTLGVQWITTIGVDVAAYSALQLLQAGNVNYAPLLGLPLLLASVLGSRTLALGTAAVITLMLLAEAWWVALHQPGESTARFLQAGLTGTGYFIVAFLANQLAARLAPQSRSRGAARWRRGCRPRSASW